MKEAQGLRRKVKELETWNATDIEVQQLLSETPTERLSYEMLQRGMGFSIDFVRRHLLFEFETDLGIASIKNRRQFAMGIYFQFRRKVHLLQRQIS